MIAHLVAFLGLMAVQVLFVDTSIATEPPVASKVIEDAIRAAVKVKSLSDRAQILALISNIQTKSRQLTGARETQKHAIKSIDAMRMGQLRDQTIQILAASQALAGDIQGAMASAAKVSNADRKHDILHSIIVLQAERSC